MSLKEQTIILTDTDSQGNTIMQFPITKAKNIEDVMSIAQGGTGQTTASGVRNALGLGNTTGAVPIANGGTGATSVAGARNNLGLGNTSGALPIANGGTGATTASQARTNLGLATVANTGSYNDLSNKPTIPSAYNLPTASASVLGGIKVGSGLSISSGGVLSVSNDGIAYKIPYGTCSTATATAAKVASITNGVPFSLVAGAVVAIKLSNYIDGYKTKTPTLNVNSTGAKNIVGAEVNNINWYRKPDSYNIYTDILGGGVKIFVYDGTYWNTMGIRTDYSGD